MVELIDIGFLFEVKFPERLFREDIWCTHWKAVLNHPIIYNFLAICDKVHGCLSARLQPNPMN